MTFFSQMLNEKEVQLLRKELETAKNPLFIYDDDADGLSAFLLLYRINHEGKGISPKTGRINIHLLRKVEEINPDKIFILDIPNVDQEFLDKVNRPVFWLDHHNPVDAKKVHYFNPRITNPDAYIPTTRMAWQISENNDDLWIATVGCFGDWHMPDFIEKFIDKYPDLLTEKKDLKEAVYHQKIGKLVKMFFFLQKGPSSEIRKSVKILTRIKSPDEILGEKSPAGKFLLKRFEKINQKYQELIDEAKKQATRDQVFVYQYSEDKWSFSAVLANELTNLFPDKVIIACRRKSGEMKCSLRAQFPIVDALKKALEGVEGFGGGHPVACGAVVKEEDWDLFLRQFKKELGLINDKSD